MALCAAGCGGDDGMPGPGERLETTVDGVDYGSPCAVDDDCGDVGAGAECCTGGKCGPDGWCSPRCDSDQDCPDGYFCVDHDGSRCFMACGGDDRDCPVDFVCEEKSGHLTCRYKD